MKINIEKEYRKLLNSKWLTPNERKKIKLSLRKIRKRKKTKKVKFRKKKKDETKRNSYRKYIASPEWKELRKEIIERDDGHCVFCYSQEQLHVHHLTYENFGKEKLIDLITVCKKCHKEFHPNKNKLSH